MPATLRSPPPSPLPLLRSPLQNRPPVSKLQPFERSKRRDHTARRGRSKPRFRSRFRSWVPIARHPARVLRWKRGPAWGKPRRPNGTDAAPSLKSPLLPAQRHWTMLLFPSASWRNKGCQPCMLLLHWPTHQRKRQGGLVVAMHLLAASSTRRVNFPFGLWCGATVRMRCH